MPKMSGKLEGGPPTGTPNTGKKGKR